MDISNRPLSYECLKSVFVAIPFEKRRALAIACPSVRTIQKKLPHRFQQVRIITEYPFFKLDLDGFEWRVEQVGDPRTAVTPTRRQIGLHPSVSVYSVTKYYLDRPGTSIHTLVVENCFFTDSYHAFPIARIENLRMKYRFGNLRPFIRAIENIQFGAVEVVNISIYTGVFREIQKIKAESMRVATVKISDDSLFQLNHRLLDIFEFETDLLKFKSFCEKLKSASIGSMYCGDFLWALFGMDIILNCLKESLSAEKRYLDGRKCLHVRTGVPGTELNIVYEQLCGMQMFKYRFTAQVMAEGKATRQSPRKRCSRFVRKFIRNTLIASVIFAFFALIFWAFFY